MSDVLKAAPATFTEGLKGFSAMCRSGAMDASDGEMITKKFDEAREEIKRLRAAIRAIQQATLDGKVCDDVAWFSDIETLHDFCAATLAR